jgi:hypothetical protein
MTFPTSKEAYIWFVDKVLQQYPGLLNDADRLKAIAQGVGGRYFAKSQDQLFIKSPHQADESTNYERVSGGWYANVKLTNPQKRKNIENLATHAGLQRSDWSWEEV